MAKLLLIVFGKLNCYFTDKITFYIVLYKCNIQHCVYFTSFTHFSWVSKHFTLFLCLNPSYGYGWICHKIRLKLKHENDHKVRILLHTQREKKTDIKFFRSRCTWIIYEFILLLNVCHVHQMAAADKNPTQCMEYIQSKCCNTTTLCYQAVPCWNIVVLHTKRLKIFQLSYE